MVGKLIFCFIVFLHSLLVVIKCINKQKIFQISPRIKYDWMMFISFYGGYIFVMLMFGMAVFIIFMMSFQGIVNSMLEIMTSQCLCHHWEHETSQNEYCKNLPKHE